MEADVICSFGQSDHERIEIEVFHYEQESSGDYYDDNWLAVQIRVAAGGFLGKVDAAILAPELEAFLIQLRVLHESLRGNAEFATVEGQLHLQLSGDGKGHIEMTGIVADQPGIGNTLRFGVNFDQSQLGTSLHELERLVRAFPTRGVMPA
jgi:hypothetical protein